MRFHNLKINNVIMKNRFNLLMIYIFLVLLGSCTSHKPMVTLASLNHSGPRTLVIDGDTITDKEVGGFKCWYCKDYIKEGPILVEVGLFGDPQLENFGFVLYDNSNKGELTRYERKGLEHRWDWGDDLVYSFTIKPDGTGAYHDFTGVPEGERIKADGVYKCYQR